MMGSIGSLFLATIIAIIAGAMSETARLRGSRTWVLWDAIAVGALVVAAWSAFLAFIRFLAFVVSIALSTISTIVIIGLIVFIVWRIRGRGPKGDR